MSKDILNGMSEEEIKKWRNVVTKATNGKPEEFSEILYRKRIVNLDLFDEITKQAMDIDKKLYDKFKGMEFKSVKEKSDILAFYVTVIQLLLDHLTLESKVFVLSRALLTIDKYETLKKKFTKAFLEEFENEKR